MRIGINGFGRVGRCALRSAVESGAPIEWAGINDVADVAALAHLLKDRRPDILLSGVNRGPNLGDDTTYSGTVAGALEGSIHGLPAIAVIREGEIGSCR